VFGNLHKHIAVFVTAVVVTYLLTPLVRSLACRFGIMDMPGERRVHKHPTARGGGLAVVIGFHAACLVGLMFPNGTRPGGFDMHWYLGFAPASLILLVVGLVDDVRGMKAWKKLLGQVLAGLLVCLSGTHFGKVFGWDLPWLLDDVCVVIWIVAVVNSFNLIDGLDGLASGLAIISATGLGGILILGNVPGVVVPLVALTGACLAFLRYNFHPATIFLGDTGSMFLGLVLGVVSLQSFTKNTFFLSMTIPMLVLGVPIYDALLAIWRRSVRRILTGAEPGGMIRRTGIMDPDKDHLHHRLSKAGLSTRRVATVLFIINGGLAMFGLLMTTFQSHASGIFLLTLLAAVYVLLRHMAVIELRDTGKVLLTGLRRPTHALFRSLLYSVWDMFCLAASLGIAMWAVELQRDDFWHSWFLEMPVWVTPTFSLLAISRAYVTVWTRARVLDVLMLLFTLQAGLLLSLGIALLIDPSNAHNWFLRALVMAAIGHAGIIGVRIFYRSVEEVVLFLKPQDPTNDRQRIVLYGAGGRCQLILRERSFSNSSAYEGCTIVGLIDDEAALHFKWVYGHMVLGGGQALPQLITRHRLTGIVLTTNLRPEALARVRYLAGLHNLSLSEWCFESKMIDIKVRSSQEEFIPVAAATKTSD